MLRKLKGPSHRARAIACSRAVLLQAAACLLLSAACCPSDVPVIRGEDFNPLVITSERLDGRKVVVEDFMSDHKRTFTTSEGKRGFKEHFYVKFVLRDSKLPCFLCRYDYRDMERLMEIRKGDRVRIIGSIERLGRGVKRFVNPKLILKVDEISKGWEMGEEKAVLEAVRDEEPIDYLDIPPAELENTPEEHEGKCVRIRDRFSLRITHYTNFEKDLSLSTDTALKFRGELLPWPYYLVMRDENKKILSGLKAGDKITVFARVQVRDIPDDRLILLSAHAVRKGWE